MTSEERRFLLDHLARTRTLLLDAVAGLSAAQWHFEPEPDVWSIAHCAGHVELTEASIFARLTGPHDRPAKAVDRTDDFILRAVRGRKHRATAPEPLRPASLHAKPEEFARNFIALRNRVIDYVALTTADVRANQDPHFALQMLDGYQWLLLIGSHAERHAAQIDEIKRHPSFPRV
ncbi:MAG: DinB family protein [Bryobacteraceae bacterium]